VTPALRRGSSEAAAGRPGVQVLRCPGADAIDETPSAGPGLPGPRQSVRWGLAAAREIERVGDNQVEALLGHRSKQIATTRLHPHPVQAGVQSRRDEGAPADVDGHDLGPGQGRADRQQTASGAQVKDGAPRTERLAREHARKHQAIAARLKNSGQGQKSHASDLSSPEDGETVDPEQPRSAVVRR
jgi:hypothetical protein